MTSGDPFPPEPLREFMCSHSPNRPHSTTVPGTPALNAATDGTNPVARASRRPPAAARPRHRHNPQARVRLWDSHLQQGPCRSSPLPRPARCRSFRRRRVQGHHGEEQSPEGSGAPRQQLDGLCHVPLVPSPGTARKRGKSSGWTPSSELCSDEPGDHRIKVDMVCQADVHLEQPPYLLCSLAEEGGTMARQAEGGEEPCKGWRTSPLQAQEEPSAQSAPWAFNEQVLAELFDSSLHIVSESDCSYDPTERGSEDNFSSSRSEGSISVPGVHASASGSTRSSVFFFLQQTPITGECPHVQSGVPEARRHSCCNISECLCPGGREQGEEEGRWQLLLCSSCVAKGTHQRCSDLRNEETSWECDSCAGLGTGTSVSEKGKSPKAASFVPGVCLADVHCETGGTEV
ncbi:uncharacterized protein LOC141938233 [Strix uralensis]|uniref:uncharacterized protein LOC141938233 n=1 Tax=Strix uralensis TaxID=36305 RepID=UPI003DA75568